jgi:hypothetical protein
VAAQERRFVVCDEFTEALSSAAYLNLAVMGLFASHPAVGPEPHTVMGLSAPHRQAHRALTHTSALFTFCLARNARACSSFRSIGFCAV